MTRCFRLCSSKYPAGSGIGAALHGGRWNPVGVEVVYSAATASLAALEVLVHYAVLPRGFVLTEIRIPDDARIEVVDRLPPSTAEFGRAWASELRSTVLSVPSALVPSERIYVLNPGHPGFASLQFLPPEPFVFDRRLK